MIMTKGSNIVEDEIHEQIERTPRSYASVAYDTLWVASASRE